jgi:hypothetical protein
LEQLTWLRQPPLSLCTRAYAQGQTVWTRKAGGLGRLRGAAGKLQQLDGFVVVLSDGHLRSAGVRSTSARACANSSGSPSHHSASDAIASSSRSGCLWTSSARYSANDAAARACRRASSCCTASGQLEPVGVCVDILRPLRRNPLRLPRSTRRKQLVRRHGMEKALLGGRSGTRRPCDFSGDRLSPSRPKGD